LQSHSEGRRPPHRSVAAIQDRQKTDGQTDRRQRRLTDRQTAPTGRQTGDRYIQRDTPYTQQTVQCSHAHHRTRLTSNRTKPGPYGWRRSTAAATDSGGDRQRRRWRGRWRRWWRRRCRRRGLAAARVAYGSAPHAWPRLELGSARVGGGAARQYDDGGDGGEARRRGAAEHVEGD
jgi:hypothetical protein